MKSAYGCELFWHIFLIDCTFVTEPSRALAPSRFDISFAPASPFAHPETGRDLGGKAANYFEKSAGGVLNAKAQRRKDATSSTVNLNAEARRNAEKSRKFSGLRVSANLCVFALKFVCIL